MAAYLRVRRTIHNEEPYRKHGEAAVPLIMEFVGKLLARGGKVDVLEGEPDDRPMVIFEFPSLESPSAFWNSEEYAPVKKLREGAGTLNISAVPEVSLICGTARPARCLWRSGPA